MGTLVVVIAMAGVGFAIATNAGSARRRREAWSEIARELGGQYVARAGWFSSDRERIEAVVRGVRIVVDWHKRGSGNHSQTYTRVTAAYPHVDGPSGRVYRQGILSSIGKAFGTQDVALGVDAMFDERFVVKTEQVALMRRLWTPRAAELMLRSFSDVELETQADHVEIEGRGMWLERDRIVGAVDLLAELAGRDLYGAAALGAVPGGTFSERGGPRVELDAPVRVVIAPEEIDGRLVTCARLADAPAIDALTIGVEDGRTTDAALATKLPQSAHVPLRRVGTGTLVVDAAQARFEWRDIELDPDRLRAAAELLGALATASSGVYR